MKLHRIDSIPLHGMLVHFPIAAWSATTLLCWAGLYDAPFLAWAWYCNVIGLVTALVAVAAGVFELHDIPPQSPAQPVAIRHMLLVASAFASYLVTLLLQAKLPGLPAALAGSVAFAFLLAGGHLGARLVYHYHLPDTGIRERHD